MIRAGLHYQLQIESNLPVGAEAPIRWNHPLRDNLAPKEVYTPGRRDWIDSTFGKLDRADRVCPDCGLG